MHFSDRSPQLVSKFEDALAARLPAPDDEDSKLPRAMRYAVLDGGKRMRPLLTFAAAEALGIDSGRVETMAMAVELIHCYSLVHDDLPAMDDDDLRRGKPTVHVAFDEATAILTGDALLTLAFEILAEDAVPADAMRVLARSAGAGGMVGGQALDLAFEATRPKPQALERMFAGKTGALIVAAVEMPATLSVAPDSPERTALRDYGRSIGLAFQIIDDLLDLEGDTEELGKPARSDLGHDKATWPAVFGVDASRAQAEELQETAWRALAQLPGDTDGLRWLGQRIVDRRN